MKRYEDMSMKEVNEIANKGGSDMTNLAHQIREYLDNLDLSDHARNMIATSDQYGIVEGFGGLFTVEEVEKAVEEME